MTRFADRLRACIDERHTSQAELARAAGVSGASMSDWVNDKTQAEHIKAEPLLRAAAFLNVSPMWLLTGKGARQPHAPTVLQAAEGAPKYADWPFEVIDLAVLRSLKATELARIEGAWLLVAKQMGYSLEKQAAA
jgi:transcriptional regulator with XRE-family HTH domain